MDVASADSSLWRRLWQWWKVVAGRIGDVQARVLLAAFYFVVLAPFAFFVRLTGDPLALRRTGRRGWQARVEPAGTALEQAQRQF